MAKKKKMTPAQAAAARREMTPEAQRRAEARRHSKEVRENVHEAQREASQSGLKRFVVPAVVVVVIAALSLAVTFLPGMLMGQA